MMAHDNADYDQPTWPAPDYQCDCGCGLVVPDPPFGGIMQHRGYECAWYASNACIARDLRLHAEHES